MSSASVATAMPQTSLLGTVVVLPWASDPDAEDPSTPFLLLYPLGDGKDGADASGEAMNAMLTGLGLRFGEQLDLAKQPRSPISLLVEAGQAALTLASMKVQCAVPAEWEQAARERGQVYLIGSTRAWPAAVPGEPVDEESLSAYVSDETLLEASAHALVPVRSLRR
ncbi:DUF5949 family protein [Streptomyces sp. NPDC050504]|uniref:DUF5949 family protein n=1 Tax=Streptomyces sp. NPDC050504 TaxID=3365618 RepID=UPI0037B29BAA